MARGNVVLGASTQTGNGFQPTARAAAAQYVLRGRPWQAEQALTLSKAG